MAIRFEETGIAGLLEKKAPRNRKSARVINVGLVNNMPDAAFVATARQFSSLLGEAGHGLVKLHLFHIPSVPRGDEAKSVLASRYSPIDELHAMPVDALIVTGNEPRAPKLDEEPYWPALIGLVDWAKSNTVSTVWSCLAAHAAVLHLDGIVRHPFAAKRSGVFTCEVKNAGLGRLPVTLSVCHSRYNDVRAADLLACNYTVVSQSPGDHVDTFIKDYGSRFVFFQGHPEYDADSLMREYRRDVGRYLMGERDTYPEVPENYFDTETAGKMLAFRQRVESARHPSSFADFPHASLRNGLERRLRNSANAIYRNWLTGIAGQNSRTDGICGRWARL